MRGKISCKQAVDYISKKEERQLSRVQRFALYRHLGECSLCQTFSVQNRLLAKAMALGYTEDLTAEEKETLIKYVMKTSG